MVLKKYFSRDTYFRGYSRNGNCGEICTARKYLRSQYGLSDIVWHIYSQAFKIKMKIIYFYTIEYEINRKVVS